MIVLGCEEDVDERFSFANTLRLPITDRNVFRLCVAL